MVPVSMAKATVHLPPGNLVVEQRSRLLKAGMCGNSNQAIGCSVRREVPNLLAEQLAYQEPELLAADGLLGKFDELLSTRLPTEMPRATADEDDVDPVEALKLKPRSKDNYITLVVLENAAFDKKEEQGVMTHPQLCSPEIALESEEEEEEEEEEDEDEEQDGAEAGAGAGEVHEVQCALEEVEHEVLVRYSEGETHQKTTRKLGLSLEEGVQEQQEEQQEEEEAGSDGDVSSGNVQSEEAEAAAAAAEESEETKLEGNLRVEETQMATHTQVVEVEMEEDEDSEADVEVDGEDARKTQHIVQACETDANVDTEADDLVLCAEQTLVIFDWDDTLCPTSLCMEELGVDLQTAPEGKTKRNLDILANNAQLLLQQAQTVASHVAIVTNAGEGWVQNSCQAWMPSLRETLESVEVVSARARWEPSGLTCPAEWKTKEFDRLIHTFFSSRDAQSWKNIIVVGDAEYEHEALRNVVQEAPSEFAAFCRSKSVRFVQKPTVHQLAFQVKTLYETLHLIAEHHGELDIHIPLNNLPQE